jgi:hypothetical protein
MVEPFSGSIKQCLQWPREVKVKEYKIAQLLELDSLKLFLNLSVPLPASVSPALPYSAIVMLNCRR